MVSIYSTTSSAFLQGFTEVGQNSHPSLYVNKGWIDWKEMIETLEKEEKE